MGAHHSTAGRSNHTHFVSRVQKFCRELGTVFREELRDLFSKKQKQVPDDFFEQPTEDPVLKGFSKEVVARKVAERNQTVFELLKDEAKGLRGILGRMHRAGQPGLWLEVSNDFGIEIDLVDGPRSGKLSREKVLKDPAMRRLIDTIERRFQRELHIVSGPRGGISLGIVFPGHKDVEIYSGWTGQRRVLVGGGKPLFIGGDSL